MAESLPILFDMGEVERLHAIAYTAALQSGGSREPGGEVDHLTAEMFAAMAKQANRATIRVTRRPPLRLVAPDSPPSHS